MADERPPPQDVRVVDFLGNTLLDLPDSASFHHFVEQIGEIRDSLNVLNTNMQKATEAQLRLASFYEGGGHSINASRSFETASRPPAQASGARSDTASTPMPIEEQERSLLQQLSPRSYMRRRPFHRPDINIATSEMEVDAGGVDSVGGGGGRSGGSSHRGRIIEDDWARLEAKMPNEPLRMPRAGEFTAQNLLETAAQAFGETAQRVRGRRLTSLASEQFPDATSNELASLTSDPSIARELEEGGGGSRFAGGLRDASEWVGFAAEQAPKAALLHQYAQMAGYNFGPSGVRQIGAQYGEASGDGINNIGPIPLPFQLPYTSGAGRRGIEEQWDSFRDAVLTPGLTNKDIDFYKQQAAERGYFDNDSEFGQKRMREQWIEAGKQMKRKGVPDQIIENEKTWDLLDKQTRYGNKSITDFVDTMERVKPAAEKANVSFEQLLTDMDAIGEMNQAQGGTHVQGQRLALSIAEQMGLPPGPVGEALANPLVQGRAFRDTGLMPFEQGLMNPGERVGSLMGAIQDTYGALGGMSGQKRRAPGLAGELGGTLQYGERDRKIALLHQMYPELSPEILRAMTGPEGKGLEAGAQSLMMGEQWSNQVGWLTDKMQGAVSINQMDNLQALFDPRSDKGGKFTWGDQRKLLRQSKYWDPQAQKARRMFNAEDLREIEEAGNIDVAELRKGGLSESEQEQIQAAASARYNKMRDIMKDKTQDITKGPKITIELGPAAKKAFNLQTMLGGAKAEAQRGASAINLALGEPGLGVPPFGEGAMGYGGPIPGSGIGE